MAPVITSVSPSIPLTPWTAITLTGSGFTSASQVGCPWLVATTYVSASELRATIPGDFAGASAATVQIPVYVVNADGAVSNSVTVTVTFPRVRQQTYTTIEEVVSEIPGFVRGGKVTDDQIRTWMRTTASAIAAGMLRRGLPLDPAQWQQEGADGTPAASEVLALMNRLGAAARLAAVVSAQFAGQETGLQKSLDGAFDQQMRALASGDYDKIFRPAAATVESGPALAVGDMTDAAGEIKPAFEKGRRF